VPRTAAQVGDGRPDGGLGEHAQAEGQGGRSNVVALFQAQGGGDRRQVLLGVLAVRRAACATPGILLLAHREEAEDLTVTEHPGGHAQPCSGLRDAHMGNSNNLLSRTARSACAKHLNPVASSA